MAVITVTDPISGDDILLVKGEVGKIYVDEIPAEKRVGYGKDKAWVPTHRISAVIDGQKVGLGMTDKPDNMGIKSAKDDTWTDFATGAVVTIKVTEGKPYNGKPQYNANLKSDVTINKAAPEGAKPAPAAQSSTPARKADPTELIAGNARNAASILVRRFGVDFNQAIEYCAQVAHNSKIEYSATDAKLTEFQVGVSVGEAIKIAAELAKNMEDMPDFITAYLADQVPHSLTAVKALKAGEFATPELPGTEKKPAKPARAPRASKPVPEPEQVQEVSPPADLDDDIPF